ncbi:pentapeptide repeat-containing protein [Streptomyces sp. WI04-05B]|uniref:pentapeptide repeat-containing protein n=1 Tax=Streptomyces TaxID=1883 RepID=UPI0029AAC71A|nr:MULTISPECIES: pentapeptide repeat-containing protein [unclassified Streptomyces]MDX2545419.1 pentapeptide repeat-containing protein [Streptomyces sp. WI04-05B]MDX2581806.1 pentapeptide repeat-containing protein [Streptomyces sp. WI04-05A]
MNTPTPATPAAPFRVHCGHTLQTPEGPTSCSGQQVVPYLKCLEHLEDDSRDAYLASLRPGADIDHRGTVISAQNLRRILTAVTDSTTEHPHWGTARFDQAFFPQEAQFARSHFRGPAIFQGAIFANNAGFSTVEFDKSADFRAATFNSKAVFQTCSFKHLARFEEASFHDQAILDDTRFSEAARFEWATFNQRTGFTGVEFSKKAYFTHAVFGGDAYFSSSTFSHDAQFDKSTFHGSSWFRNCRFSSSAAFKAARFNGLVRMEACTFINTAQFEQASFGGTVEFSASKFGASARFIGATFSAQAQFGKVKFEGAANFRSASFFGAAIFSEAKFAQTAGFDNVVFSSAAKFDQTSFSAATHLGPLVCSGTLHWSGAEFSKPVTIEVAAPRVRFRRTRFESSAIIRARYAEVDLTEAVLNGPVSVTAHPRSFKTNGHSGSVSVGESTLNDQDLSETASISSVRGIDVAHLVLTDVDLSKCEFSGAIQLDKIRLQGNYQLPEAPTAWRRIFGVPLIRRTSRVTLAEEQYWRALNTKSSSNEWLRGPHHDRSDANYFTPTPTHLAATYRELRKSLEDARNEPDAADFYYGEMEMRRHDKTRPAAERGLLTLYWAFSGYGLRAMRAFASLLTSLCITSALVMMFGLPSSNPTPQTVGAIESGVISLETKDPGPSLKAPIRARVSFTRFEEANRATLNSVFFRKSESDLTTPGIYIQMIARLLVPTFFILGVLAIRNRVKR